MDGRMLALFIVVTVFGSYAWKSWLKYKYKLADQAASETDQEKEALKAQVADLEERVRVLERIATDKSSRLKEEIDAL
jgi:uncharacterized membrane protein YgcG